jgi:hypothetical protein
VKTEKKDKDKDREIVMERKGEGKGVRVSNRGRRCRGPGRREIGVQKHSSVEEEIWRTIY